MHRNHRNRALLNLAYQLPCTLRIEGVCQGGMGEPCHSNQSRHGKGGAMKAHDHYFAAGCRACHVEIDQGVRLTREEKFDIWQRGYEMTQDMLWEKGLICVAGH